MFKKNGMIPAFFIAVFISTFSFAYAAVDYMALIKNADGIIAKVQQVLNARSPLNLGQTAVNLGQSQVPGFLKNYENTVTKVVDGINLLKSKGLGFVAELDALKASNLQNLDILKSLLVKSGLSDPVKQAIQRSVDFLGKAQEKCTALMPAAAVVTK